jgi:hypothetical protein
MSYLQATLHTEFSLVANTAGKLLTLGLIMMCAYIWFPMAPGSPLSYWRGGGGEVILVMLAGLVGNILMTGLTWWYTSRWQKVEFRWDTDYIRHILSISLPY